MEEEIKTTEATGTEQSNQAAESTPPAWQPPQNQEEFDQLVQGRLESAKADWVKEAAAAQPEKTAAPNEDETAQLRAELSALKNEKAVMNAGVSAEYAEFVAFKAGKQVTKDKNFEAALKEYLEQNPAYGPSSRNAGRSWGLHQGGAAPKADGVEAAFSRINPNIKT